jgi:hypothetical protein
LSFVCAGYYRSSGSSYLRSFQLAELVAQRLDPVRVRELVELAGEIGDEVLVFNKSCLQPEFLVSVLERLPDLRRHNLCLADPVDLLLPEEVFRNFDGVIAASFGQAEYLAARLSTPVFLIHHHVDLRLTGSAKEWSAARVAYFGELSNTRHVDTISDLVDFFSIDTMNSIEIPWAKHLPFYNVHYCLRRAREFDGFKPATKLFLAASLEATVVIERHNDEARRLLPPDYPYYADSIELSDARATLRRVAKTFGKDDWLYARSCLAAIDCYRRDRIADSLEDMMRAIG